MRKALMPMVASLALCGAATAALIATTARAEQQPKKPVMVALASTPSLADDTAAPPMDGGMMPPPDMQGRRDAMCKDMVARQTGEMAYLETKLALTSTQAPLFARWKGVMLDSAQKHQADCLARPQRTKEGRDLMDGMAREETMLKTRLSELQTERPSLTALYASLTPEQKGELARAARHKMEGRMHMAMGMMGGRDGMHRGGPGMGPMGHGPLGRGPDGVPPPPPPGN